MKSTYVDTLEPNDVITAQFLVISKEIRQKKSGEPYLSLHLADRTGEIEAKMWDNVAEVMDTFERDDFVKVKGLAQVYQNRSQFTIHRVRRLEDHEVDLADFFPCSEQDPEQMFGELQEIVAAIGNPHLRGLLQMVFSDVSLSLRYKAAPAAKTIHHACRGGLLEHVLSLTKLSRLMASHYKGIDLDLLIAGAILHDIGKVEELTYVRSFGYSSEGKLLGHIIIGLRIVGEKLAQIPDFPPKLRTLLEHMIISHHGELEFGSPKVPVFQEAMLLHHLDNLDSKMETMKSAIKRDSQIEGEFTGWIGSLERSLLRKERYLAETAPAETKVDAAKGETESSHGNDGFELVPPTPTPQPVAAAQTTLAAATHSAPVPHEIPKPAQTTRPSPLQPLPLAPDLPQSPSAPITNSVPQRAERPAHKPVANTLFGEKLQAVLDTRK